MKLKLTIFSILLLTIAGYGQNTILFQENFESGGTSFFLNQTGLVGTNTGTNEWIVDTNYFAGGIYPATMNEDSTFGGTISFAPFSHYLHIYDVPSTYLDCLYNPANASDRFSYTWEGVCTFTYTGVTLNFFYLCQGSPNAYGTVYYSRENGPWTQCGILQYNSKYKWQYASITNPAFDNISNLRIGFRWQNNAGAGSDTSAFAIDDISIVATSGSSSGTITTMVSPDTVCADANASVLLSFTLSDSLCDGTYAIDLVDSVNNVVSGWTGYGYSPTTNGPYVLTIPTLLAAGRYKWVVNRTSPPALNGVLSGYFYIVNCPNSITTLQPSATMDTNSPVCVGSIIMVPFYSSGTFGNTNTYYAELSDSSGSFAPPDTIGPFFNNQAYPASVGTPGNVMAEIPNVPAGCHYYLRVVSDTPHVTGATFGPFCIQHCNMNGPPSSGGGNPGTTGNFGNQVILACMQSCYKKPHGFNDTIYFNLNDPNIQYLPGNKFEIELLNTQTLAPVDTGVFGQITDTAASKLLLHIPCPDSLCNLNLLNPFAGGPNYFMRIIATNSNPPDSNVGPLMYLQIGYPNDSLSIQPSVPNTYCYGGTSAILYADPFNFCTFDQISPNTTQYTWYVDNVNQDIPGSGISFSSTTPEGTYTIMVKETNDGCTGPLDTLIMHIDGAPSVTVSGPLRVCLGDTATYSVPFQNNTVYHWSASHVHVTDTANNVFKARFDSIGGFNISVTAIDSCGFSSNSRHVTVIARPPKPTGPSAICAGSSATFVATGGTNYSWSPTTWLSCATCATTTATPPATTQYVLAVNNGVCMTDDTMKLLVNPVPRDTACCSQTILVGQSVGIALAPGAVTEIYSWAPTATLSCNTCTNPIATPASTTTYTVTIIDTTDNCNRIDSVTIDVNGNCGNIFVPTAFSPNGDGENDVLYVKAPPCFTSVDFKIYDRWGNVVFETNDLNIGWDGKYHGMPMNTGTYVYYLSGMSNGTPAQVVSKKGNIALVR
jgi:gliding motility-associated-like protein